MSRMRIAALALLAFIACKKQSASPATDEAHPAAADMQGDDGAAQEVGGGQKPTVLTADLVSRYIRYWEKDIQRREKLMGEMRRLNASVESGGAAGSAAVMEMSQLSERAQREEAALRKEHGLVGVEISRLEALVSEVIAHELMRQQVPERLEELEQMEKDMATLPAGEQGVARAQLQELKQQMQGLGSVERLREQFGATATDAALQQQKKLEELAQREAEALTEK
jgi:hypothetical protein